MFETISTLPLFQSLDVVGGRLILTLSNGAKLDKGPVVGPSGSAGPAGVGVTHTVVDGSGHLQVTYTDGSTVDAGAVVGATGAAGRGITSTAIQSGMLVVSYSDGTTATLGSVVGPAGAAGRGITGTAVDAAGNLTVSYSDGTTASIGNVKGQTGAAGRGISSTAITNGSLVVTFTDGTSQTVGVVVGPTGPTGPAAWGSVAPWAANTAYTSIAPASVVTYDDGTGLQVFVAKAGVGAFTSGASFNASNWTLIAAHGAAGQAGAAGRGVSSTAVNGAGHLIVTYSDGATSDAGATGDPAVAAAVAALKGNWPHAFTGGKVTTVGTLLVSGLNMAAGDQVNLQSSDGAAFVYTVGANDTIQTFLNAVNAATATTKLAASLDPLGRPIVYSTTGGALVTITGSAASVVPALFGQTETSAATITLAPAANEADVRAKTALAIEMARQTSKRIVVSLPAGPINFAAQWTFQNVAAQNVNIVGQTAVGVPVNTGVQGSNIVAVGSNNASGQALYDVTFTGADFSAFAVGSVAGIEGVAVGIPTLDWPEICGGWIVRASSTNAITVRVSCPFDLTKWIGTGIPTTGSQAVTWTIWRYPTQLVFPASTGGIVLQDSDLGGIGNLSLSGSGAPTGTARGVSLSGARARLTLGNVAVTGFGDNPFYAEYGARLISARTPNDVAVLGSARHFGSGGQGGLTSYAFALIDFSAAATLCITGIYYAGLWGFYAQLILPNNTIAGGVGQFCLLAYRDAHVIAPITGYTLRGFSGNSANAYPCIKADVGSICEANGLNGNMSNVSPQLNTQGNNYSVIFTY